MSLSAPPAAPTGAADLEDGLPSVVTSDDDHINLFFGRSDFAVLALLSGGRGAAREREPEANPKPNPKMRKEEVREERTKSTKGARGGVIGVGGAIGRVLRRVWGVRAVLIPYQGHYPQ